MGCETRRTGWIAVLTVAACLWTPTSARAGELDCDNNGVPDAEELSGHDCNANGVLDMCELDTLHAVANLATGADSNPEARPSFDIEGDLIAIGEPLGSAGGGNGNGLVRIFRRSGGVWAPETTLPGPEFSSRFGADVDVSGNRVAIAAPGFDQDRGKVFIYRFDSDGGTWVEEAGIEGAEAPFSVRFGRAIALDGRRLVISREPYARRFASDFYDLESGAWTFRLSRYDMSPLMPPDARPPPALALSEGVLVAFETVPNPPFGDGGYVTLLELDGGAWNRVGRFIVNGGIHFPSLVDGIEITSNRVVVAIGGFTVAAFLRTAEGWTREATFFASDLPPGYAFGRWSAHQGERVFIGATVSNTPSLVEIDFSQDPPALLPMDAWTGVVEQGVFSGSDFGYLDESSQPSLHMVALTADCDNDGALDECELAAGAADVDNDRVPDSCEMDCNQDGVPDDRQLDDGDCNSNGVLDECDVNASDPDGDGLVISDCNNNGIPDDCEPDCDGNGVPDDCDIDVADPDGDGAVAPDCDGNGIVDNCDILGGVREIAQLRPSISAAGFQFGTSIAIDGDVIVVGSTTSPLRTTDKVFVFRRHGDAWLEEAVIQPAAGSGLFDEFIAIASGRIFIAQFESSFSSFRQIAVYERLDGEWRRTGTIGSAGEDSSECVAIGDEALVRESLANAASLYRQMEGEWTRVETYFSSLPDFPYRGGLAMNDEFAVVGAEGGFRVFDKNDSAMVSGPHLPISPENVVSSNRSIVMTDEFVVVGYPRVFAELSYDATGAVNVYRRHAGDEASSAGGVSWAPDAILTLGISGGQYQGVAVGAEGDRCFVGYPDYASADGAVGFYEYDGAAWQLRALIQPNISPSPLYFGAAIATSASYLAVSAGVGVSGVLNSSEDVVVVYAIDLDIDDNGVHDTCEVDCDANHYPDEGERTIDGFVGALLNGGALCVFDLNDDGALNGLDIDPMIEQLLMGP